MTAPTINVPCPWCGAKAGQECVTECGSRFDRNGLRYQYLSPENRAKGETMNVGGVYVLMARTDEGVEQLRGVYSTRGKASKAANEPGEYLIYAVPIDGEACSAWPAASGEKGQGDA